MTRRPLVPDDVDVPSELVTADFRLVPLGPCHNASDHAAWTSSINHIRATPGFEGRSWPPEGGMSLAQNLADLENHATEFAERVAFTYTVLAPTTGEVIGCVYLKPPHEKPPHGQGVDVEVLSWVRADRAHLDTPLYRAVRTWLDTAWPFTAVEYAAR
jgi:hypothetical protein